MNPVIFSVIKLEVEMKAVTKSIIYILLLYWVLSVNVPASAQIPQTQSGSRIVFDRLNVEDGLSYPGINDMTQDEQGFIWIATSRGLNRYDGYNFRVYQHDRSDPTSISANHTEVVLQDNQNPDIFWVAADEGLNKFDRRSETFTWYLHDPDPSANSLGANNIYELLQTPDGNLWIGFQRAGLDRFDPDTETFTHYRNDPDDPDSLAGDSINRLYLAREGQFWVATRSNGLDLFDPQSETFTHYRNYPDNANSLSSDEVETIMQDAAGVYWIGTESDGLECARTRAIILSPRN